MILTAINPWFEALPPLLGLAGASMTLSNTSANTLLQGTADRHLLGRTVSLYMLSMQGGMSLGALLTGASVMMLGVQSALLLNGFVALVVQLTLARLWFQEPLPNEASA